MAHIYRFIIALLICIAPLQLFANENHAALVNIAATDSDIEIKTAVRVSVVNTPNLAIMYQNKESIDVIICATAPINNIHPSQPHQCRRTSA